MTFGGTAQLTATVEWQRGSDAGRHAALGPKPRWSPSRASAVLGLLRSHCSVPKGRYRVGLALSSFGPDGVRRVAHHADVITALPRVRLLAACDDEHPNHRFSALSPFPLHSPYPPFVTPISLFTSGANDLEVASVTLRRISRGATLFLSKPRGPVSQSTC